MEFIDNTGHIFSLSSYKEKPIGYEYDEDAYIFWVDANTSYLSINNYYSRPIYILYELENDYSIKELQDNDNSPVQISIEINNSNVFSLIASKEINNVINSDKFNDLNDYINLNELDDNGTETNSFIKKQLTNDDLIVYKTHESISKKISNNENSSVVEIPYLVIPIYPICNSVEPGVWITNILIHIYDRITNNHSWCPISVGGEFINEYEELVINGKNTGVNLPKDILKAVYSESLYNHEFNESLYNEKLKEYLINIISIKHECGNFKSAIDSLKWFGYADKLSISKLLKTDNELKDQYILDYFDISYDIIDAFKNFYTDSLISLKLMINKELDEQYAFECNKDFWGENKPKTISLLDHYEKVEVGHHTVIEDTDETYWYWKPYFDFSFTELGIKLMCLKYFYKKYFLPIHLYIHSTSLGYRVYANDIKFTSVVASSLTASPISLNAKKHEVEFDKYSVYYFTRQIHFIDDYFNEFNVYDVNNDNRTWYKIDDTCVSIPIKFISNDINNGYFNCVLILQDLNDELLYESHFSFYQTNNSNKNKNYEYRNFVIYPKKLNRYISKNKNDIKLESNYFEYWVNKEFIIKLLVNNKWYEHKFMLKIHNPIIDFGTLRYRYWLNDHNYLLGRLNNKTSIHSLIFSSEIDSIINGINNANETHESVSELLNINANDYYDSLTRINNNLYKILGLNSDISFVKTINTIDKLYKGYEYTNNEYIMKEDDTIDNVDIIEYGISSHYNILSPFTQIKYINDDNHTISFNAYMHHQSLASVNNIDFDVDFYKILQYHLDHNLLYIDGTLVNKAFYQYIVYTIIDDDNIERNIEILLQKDLIGYDIEIPTEYINQGNIVVGAWNDNLYILTENSEHDNQTYFINTLYENDIIISEADGIDSYALLFDSVRLKYDRLKHAYYTIHDNNGTEERKYYYIYDKLYNNLSYINDKYINTVNISDLDKYKNSIHLFNIYTTEKTENNILYFHNDFDISVNNLYFSHKKYINTEDDQHESMKIYITKKNIETNQNIVDSRYIDVYGLHWVDINNIPIEERHKLQEFGFYIKRDYASYYNNDAKYYYVDESETKCVTEPTEYDNEGHHPNRIYELNNILEFSTNEFSEYKETEYTIAAKYYYKNLDNFLIHKYIEGEEEIYVNSKIEYDNESKSFYFYDEKIKCIDDLSKSYKNDISYKIRFIDANGNTINISLNDIDNNAYDKIEITMFYKKNHIVRNRFYTILDLMNERDDIVSINMPTIDDPIMSIEFNNNETIELETIYLGNKYSYLDNDNYPIPNQNPSMYWYNIDTNGIESLSYYLNELERYIYDNEEETLEEIIEKLDEYKQKYITKEDDSIEARYQYDNYLSKDMTGITGTFRLDIEHNLENDIAILCCEIINEDSTIDTYYSNDNNIFTLNGNEKKVTIYIKIDTTNINADEYDTYYILPLLYETKTNDKLLKYNYQESGDDVIKVKIDNKEYYYGNNNGEFIYNLYSDFFDLKFNIYDIYEYNHKLEYELLNSVYDVKEQLKLNAYLDYDFYLMHDNEYWYALYISRETCDYIRKPSDLIIPDTNKEMIIHGERTNIDYKLKFDRSSKECLINRLEFISSNGFNQFKDDDIIACYIYNNDRLQFNPYISSKWNITPASLGMTNASSFESNGEMTILSLPKNNSKYEHGYYKVTVKYSLDRDIQHQFKNTSTIKIS